jgi:hypothetical protein
MITFNKPNAEKQPGFFMMPLLGLNLKRVGINDDMLRDFFKKLEDA